MRDCGWPIHCMSFSMSGFPKRSMGPPNSNCSTKVRDGPGRPISPPAAIWFWSDIPNDRIMRWDEATGTSGIFRYPAGHTNGHTVDRQGRLVSCEHGGRRVSRTEHDGSITTIADRFEGKRLNSPNDVVVKSDNSIWFTDPAYGIDTDYEGHKAESEIGGTTFTGWTRKPARSRSLPAISFDPTALHFS